MIESLDHPYSLVRTVDGVTAYVSGVLPYAEDHGTVVHEREQAIGRALTVLRERLEGAGFELNDVVKTTVFLTDLSWRGAVNAAYHATFSEPRPARTTVEVRALPGGAPIEIDAVVYRRPA